MSALGHQIATLFAQPTIGGVRCCCALSSSGLRSASAFSFWWPVTGAADDRGAQERQGSGGTIRLMTWNIHGGVRPDRQFDLDRVANVVAVGMPRTFWPCRSSTRAAVIQHAWRRCKASLRRMVDFAEARTVVAEDGHYGHALFSRWPLGDVLVH